MSILNSKLTDSVSKFKLRLGIILLILGLGTIAFGTYAIMHTRENVLMTEDAVKRTLDKIKGFSETSAASRNSKELEDLYNRLAFYESNLDRDRGYFTRAILILVGGVLVSSVGFCLVYLHRLKMRQLAQAESGSRTL